MMLTVKEAAEKLSCSTTHVRRMIEAGRLAATDIGIGKHHEYRISEQAIESLFDAAEPIKQPKKKRRKLTGIERFV